MAALKFPDNEKGERECVISFDEMHLKQRWCYDQAEKRVLKPAKKLQCVFLRGLIHGWKTPVFFAFDAPVTVSLLQDIVKKTEELGFKVRACSFDLGNKEFLTQTGFYKGQKNVPNPVAEDRIIHMIPDPPTCSSCSVTICLKTVR